MNPNIDTDSDNQSIKSEFLTWLDRCHYKVHERKVDL